MEFFNKIIDFFSSPLFTRIIGVFLFFYIVVWLSFVYWVYRDAAKRGAIAIFWAFIVFVFNLPALIVYLIVRPPEYKQDVVERELEIKMKQFQLNSENNTCPGCERLIENDFLICPYCRKKLKTTCVQCGKPIALNWTICPYCKNEV